MSELTDASIAFDSQLNMCEKKLCVCGDEWEPGEYVVKVLPGVGAEPLELTHERVIRCKDCRFYDKTIHSCGRIDVAAKAFVSYVFDGGFCAWAEPKEEA